MIDLQDVKVKNTEDWNNICPFPVGYIYMSTNGTSPASTYGGTWSSLTDSRFLRPSGSWNSTGGESTHVLTVREIPRGFWNIYSASSYNDYNNNIKTLFNIGSTYGINVGQGGDGQGHNNLPPYRTCYAWYRTA